MFLPSKTQKTKRATVLGCFDRQQHWVRARVQGPVLVTSPEAVNYPMDTDAASYEVSARVGGSGRVPSALHVHSLLPSYSLLPTRTPPQALK